METSIIPFSNTPIPQKATGRKNDLWLNTFKAIQAAGGTALLDGEWTTSQMTGVRQRAEKYSGQSGMGKIRVTTRARRIRRTGPRHKQYMFRIWITVSDEIAS